MLRAAGGYLRSGGRQWLHASSLRKRVGTFFLVFFAVGVATLSFGFKFAGASVSAGVVATALAFGLVLLVLAYTLGPISGCHVNPAVTMGFVVSGRMAISEAVGYWIAQFVGGIAGALVLWGVLLRVPALLASHASASAPTGSGTLSMVHINAVGGLRGRGASSPCCSCSWSWPPRASWRHPALPAWPSDWP